MHQGTSVRDRWTRASESEHGWSGVEQQTKGYWLAADGNRAPKVIIT